MRKADLKGLEADKKKADKLIWEVEKSCSEEVEERFGRKGTLIHFLHKPAYSWPNTPQQKVLPWQHPC